MNTKNTRIMLALIVLFGAFVMFACDDVEVEGVEVWDADSPAGKAVNGAGDALGKASDTVGDLAKDVSEGALTTDFSHGKDLCNGLKCNGK